MFLVCKSNFWLEELVFHLVALANLPDPLENDFVLNIKSHLDDKDVIHFMLNHDLALMHHMIFTHDVYVPLVENFESRPLGDNDGVLQRSVDQHIPSLAMAQEPVWVRKIR